MARKILAYECQFCGTIKKTRNIAERHEISCKMNPDAHNCMLCKNAMKLEKCVKGGGRYWCPTGNKACSSAVGANCERFDRK
jgi:hypothetical protein